MNYESLYQSLQSDEKSLKEGISSLQKLYKSICRETENGDLKSLLKDLTAMSEALSSLSAALENMKAAADGFDSRSYFESGDLQNKC